LLLDTQVALWWLTASRRLSKPARELVAGSDCVLSVASIWEVDLKHRIGKLPVSAQRFRDEMRIAGAIILSVADEHVLRIVRGVEAHRDPFDRMLLSVAEAEQLTLLTADDALISLGRKNPNVPVRRACASRFRADQTGRSSLRCGQARGVILNQNAKTC
jgi:PIN domain nuclease of toxin-antitoxin system